MSAPKDVVDLVNTRLATLERSVLGNASTLADLMKSVDEYQNLVNIATTEIDALKSWLKANT
jgi:hypothetical protein